MSFIISSVWCVVTNQQNYCQKKVQFINTIKIRFEFSFCTSNALDPKMNMPFIPLVCLQGTTKKLSCLPSHSTRNLHRIIFFFSPYKRGIYTQILYIQTHNQFLFLFCFTSFSYIVFCCCLLLVCLYFFVRSLEL